MENIYIKQSNPRTDARVLGGRSPNIRSIGPAMREVNILSTVYNINRILPNKVVGNLNGIKY